MPTITKKLSSLILIGILIVAIALVVWFWILPIHKFITEKITEIQAQRGEIEQLQQQRQVVAQDDTGNYDQIARKIAGGLVGEDSIIKLIEELEIIAGQAGVEYQLSVQGEGSSLDRATTSRPPDQKDPRQAEAEKETLKLNLSLLGSFSKHLQVLNKIEYLPIVINVDTISIKRNVSLVGTKPETEEPLTAEVINAEYSLTIPLAK